MQRVLRAGLVAALLGFVLIPANAADKAFKQEALDESAIKLEAQIKADAGTVSKPAAALRRDADAAFQKNEFRNGMVVLGICGPLAAFAIWLLREAQWPLGNLRRVEG